LRLSDDFGCIGAKPLKHASSLRTYNSLGIYYHTRHHNGLTQHLKSIILKPPLTLSKGRVLYKYILTVHCTCNSYISMIVEKYFSYKKEENCSILSYLHQRKFWLDIYKNETLGQYSVILDDKESL